MLRSLALLRNPRLTVLLSFAICLAGCGDGSEGTSAGEDGTGEDGNEADGASAGEAETAEQSAGSGDVGTEGDGTGSDSGDASSDDAGTGETESGDPPNPNGKGPAPVELGSTSDPAAPGSYVLLAKTGITNVTGSLISQGHMGLSPAAASFITGFSLIADPSNVYSTSVALAPEGRVFASDYAPPTPSNLTTAVLGMQAAYTDAAGRSNPDFLDLGSGDIGGLILEPGLYTWGSGVTIPDDVTMAGGENDVWIFQISNDLDLSTAQSVILSGGAQASNIFWQVAGEVVIHADAHFEGVILCQTGITLQTNASMDGRALSQTLVALDDNDVTAP
jgi:hypothetical protein